ncbi:MAG: stage V sporulation protein S [Candidatus Bipolaricaulia bacterium]
MARRFIERQGDQLIITPGFMDLEIDGEERTGIRFIIER